MADLARECSSKRLPSGLRPLDFELAGQCSHRAWLTFWSVRVGRQSFAASAQRPRGSSPSFSGRRTQRQGRSRRPATACRPIRSAPAAPPGHPCSICMRQPVGPLRLASNLTRPVSIRLILVLRQPSLETAWTWVRPALRRWDRNVLPSSTRRWPPIRTPCVPQRALNIVRIPEATEGVRKDGGNFQWGLGIPASANHLKRPLRQYEVSFTCSRLHSAAYQAMSSQPLHLVAAVDLAGLSVDVLSR